ncbi:MAG: SpoIIE family protein phosphatase [Deferribacterota bacterium]|nr:SpoIIE family protein phosphatase [Deferribacterota bacterium]
MLNLNNILIYITIIYFIIIILIAYYSEKLFKKNKYIFNNPYVYALTIAVYCSTWTFYGSIDTAATTGLNYLTIFIGTTLLIFTWWFLLRKIIRISEAHNIISIAGFLCFRYGKSKTLGAIATIICFLSIIPYTSLQLHAISDSISIIIRHSYNVPSSLFGDISLILIIILGLATAIFAVFFNLESKKHPGLIGAIAFQSIIVLSITLIVGIYITYFLYDGFSDIFTKGLNNNNPLVVEHIKEITSLATYKGAGFDWFSVIIMSMFAILLLPRMFHMTVVENLEEKNLLKAMYLFPLYLFLINLFAFPVAIAAILENKSLNLSSFYLFVPLINNGETFLSILAYLGGLAAGFSMILVGSIALANMAVNYIVIPMLIKFFLIRKRKLLIIYLRRVCLFVILLLTYLCYFYLGASLTLRDMGLISFSGIMQLAPAFLLGLYWKNINAKGAGSGIIFGFITWIYVVIIPYLADTNLISPYIITNGPFNIEFLKPTALFGITGIGKWGHAFFWSLLINMFSLSIVSLFTKQGDIERDTANICVHALDINQIIESIEKPYNLTLKDFEEILSNFFDRKFAKNKINEYLSSINKERGMLTSFDIVNLKNFVEKILSEAVGPSASKLILDSYINIKGIKETKFINVFRDLLSLGVGESKDVLIRKVSELNVILNISNIFSTPGNLQSKLHNVLNLLNDTFKIDAVILREKEGNKLRVLSYVGEIKSGLLISTDRLIEEESYIGKCIISKAQYAINDIDQAKLNEYSIELKNAGVLSFCHTPLVINNEVIGVMSVYSKLYKDLFSDDFLRILKSIANQIAFYINNIKQTEELIRVREISKELEIAKNIQKSLLPSKYPYIEGVDISAVCLPSEYVGGDYYDFFTPNKDTLDIVIADVSGHDAASALVMSEVRTLIKTIVSYRPNLKPSNILTLLNNILYEDLEKLGYIITIIYIRFNFSTKEAIYANAGHNYPILYRDRNIIKLDEGNILIGAIKDIKYIDYKIPIFKNDIFVLYTDGVIEAENEKEELFGESNLIECIRKNSEENCKYIQDSILDKIIKFRGLEKQKDDITMVLLKINNL